MRAKKIVSNPCESPLYDHLLTGALWTGLTVNVIAPGTAHNGSALPVVAVSSLRILDLP